MNDLILIAISFLYIFLVIAIASFIDRALSEKSELPRKFIHILVGNWIFLAPIFKSYWTMIFTPLVFVILNFYSLKSNSFSSMKRNEDINYGTVYYAISLVFLTSLSFYTQKWLYSFLGILIMAYADGFAALFGIEYGTKNFLLNSNKTYEGSFIVFIFSFLITLLTPLYHFKNISAPFLFFLSVGIINGFYAFVLELSGKDGLDNLFLPIGSGIMGGFLIYYPSKGFLLSLLVSSLILYFALKKNAITLDALSVALLTGAILYICGGVYIYLALIGFFILASYVSSLDNSYKKSIIKDKFKKENGRNYIQVLANSLPALIFSFIFYLTDNHKYLILSFVILSAASADTFASEIGFLSKRKVYSILTLKQVPRGLSGGVSFLGILGSILGSFLLSLFSYFEFGLVGVKFCFIMGFISSIIDSILGLIFQRKYLRLDGSLSDFKEYEDDKPIRGFSFVSNNTVNLVSLTIIGIISYFLLV